MRFDQTALPGTEASSAAPTFAEALDPLLPVFLLIDPVVGDPLAGSVDAQTLSDLSSQREQVWQRPVRCVALDPRVPLRPDQYPYVVALQGPNDPLYEMSFELALSERDTALSDGLDGSGRASYKIGGWLQTNAGIADLCSALQLLMTVNTEALTKARYLRLADRRVFALLRYVVGDVRLSGQLGGVKRWIYLNHYGACEAIHAIDHTGQPLRLTADEWHRMELGERLHRTIAMWLGELAGRGMHAPTTPSHSLFESTLEALQAALSSAQRWPHRFIENDDVLVWAALGLCDSRLGDGSVVRALLDPEGSQHAPVDPIRNMHRAISDLLAQSNATSQGPRLRVAS